MDHNANRTLKGLPVHSLDWFSAGLKKGVEREPSQRQATKVDDEARRLTILARRSRDNILNFMRLLEKLRLPPPSLAAASKSSEQAKIYLALCHAVPKLNKLYQAMILPSDRSFLQETGDATDEETSSVCFK